VTIQVVGVKIPALSTIGYGYGRTPGGRFVTFVGDHRPMRHLGEALCHAEEPITVEVDAWQIINYSPRVH
jgi:hypothetical protein